ncbi:MAG: threonine/serine dehydratase [Alphaproteobacteria bacterium]|jgi:threonine dehydratase|nr:threonine/serine dehydratase [Alphaproteobacteria bacterium]MDP6516285.1 threonine/serine dehydratase [Alphaproteobacteria bacterium]
MFADQEPSFAAVIQAARRIRGHARVTPLLRSDALDERVGGRLLIKAEALQRTGSFKFRGAFNRIRAMSETERARGVVAWSSGNHAQGVAVAARLLGTSALIVMPEDAPVSKVAGTRSAGAEIVFYDRYTEDREAIGTRIAEERGAALVKPHDDAYVIAGQGTAGLEAAAQAAQRGLRPDAALVPCGGGGLIAGCALALTHQLPGIALHPVTPAGFDNTARSLGIGARQGNDPATRSICDALLVPTHGALTFAVNRKLLQPGLVVSDDEALSAMAAAFRHLRLVVEPSGAVALAAALCGRFDCRGKTVLVIISGGNVDPDMFRRALEIGDAAE